MSTRVYFALGSNLGDRLTSLQAAIDGLREWAPINQVSRVYETAPMYVTDQPAFLNMVVSGSTELSPMDLLEKVKALETEIGRVPTFTNGPRAIDIDILALGDTTLESERLVLPHPRIAERAFVLAPLADIAPDLELPGTSTKVRDVLNAVDGADTIRATAMRVTHG